MTYYTPLVSYALTYVIFAGAGGYPKNRLVAALLIAISPFTLTAMKSDERLSIVESFILSARDASSSTAVPGFVLPSEVFLGLKSLPPDEMVFALKDCLLFPSI